MAAVPREEDDRVEVGPAGHHEARHCLSRAGGVAQVSVRKRDRRSEEHTSELQSRFDLVCRLLLEKKKPVAHGRQERARRGMVTAMTNCATLDPSMTAKRQRIVQGLLELCRRTMLIHNTDRVVAGT